MDQKYYVCVQLFSLFRLQSRSQMLRRRVERQLHDDRQFVFLQQLTQHAKATHSEGESLPTGHCWATPTDPRPGGSSSFIEECLFLFRVAAALGGKWHSPVCNSLICPLLSSLLSSFAAHSSSFYLHFSSFLFQSN